MHIEVITNSEELKNEHSNRLIHCHIQAHDKLIMGFVFIWKIRLNRHYIARISLHLEDLLVKSVLIKRKQNLELKLVKYDMSYISN